MWDSLWVCELNRLPSCPHISSLTFTLYLLGLMTWVYCSYQSVLPCLEFFSLTLPFVFAYMLTAVCVCVCVYCIVLSPQPKTLVTQTTDLKPTICDERGNGNRPDYKRRLFIDAVRHWLLLQVNTGVLYGGLWRKHEESTAGEMLCVW